MMLRSNDILFTYRHDFLLYLFLRIEWHIKNVCYGQNFISSLKQFRNDFFIFVLFQVLQSSGFYGETHGIQFQWRLQRLIKHLLFCYSLFSFRFTAQMSQQNLSILLTRYLVFRELNLIYITSFLIVKFFFAVQLTGRQGNVFFFWSPGPGSSPGRGHCVVFLGKTLNSHCAPLHPGV